MKGGKTKTGFLAGILVLLLVAVPAMGEQKEANLMNMSQTFNIEAGVLEDALDNYSEVTGIKTVYLNELVEGKKSPGVQGIYSPEAAVQKILKGTGLTYQVTAENTVVLKENKMVVPQKGSKATSKKEDAEEKEGVKRPIEIEEMVVTAQKREENIQDVPASITALSEVQIEDARIESTNEIHTYVPNFTSFKFGVSGFSYYSIRGQSNFIQTTRSVGIYIDDVPTSCAANATDSTIYDIERIEVLSGPQGNLHGMNSSGGVINIITKKPGNIWTAKATGGIGDYETHFYNASVSGPVVKDKLFIGLAGTREKQDEGYLDNGVTHPDTIDTQSGRVQLRWTPIEELDIIFSASGEDQDNGMGFMVPVDDDPFKIPDVNLEDEHNDLDVNTQSLRIKYKAPWFVVTSVSARNSNEYDSVYTPDLTGMNLMNMKYLDDVTEYSQEIRLNSVDSDNPFQWIVGGFYFEAEDTSDMTMNMDACLFDPTGMTPPGLMTIEDTTYSVLDTTTYSAFGQADKKEINYKHKGVAPYDASETWEAWSPKFIVDYRWNPSMLTYASVAKGYKAGGFAGGYTAETAAFDPQYVWSYEAGVKTDWLDRRLILNAAMFYSKAKDLQVIRRDPITMLPDFRNAAKATIQGLEVELLARPLQGLDIMASFGLLDTEFDDNKNIEENADYTGNEVPLSPAYTASLVAHYRSPWGIFVRGEAAWTGDTYYDEANTHEQEAYCIANGKIGYEKEHFDIYFFVNNIFDKEYWTFLYGTVMGMAATEEIGSIGPPRTLGVMATVRF
jgi:iron complex outermembrane receptor protein